MCMMARPKGVRDFEQIRSAIDEFMAGEKLTDIGERRGVSQPTVSYWLRKWGLKLYPTTFRLRKQGRRKDTVPNRRDQKIIKMIVTGRTFGEVAKKYGISRTRVAAIVATWGERGYKVPVAESAALE